MALYFLIWPKNLFAQITRGRALNIYEGSSFMIPSRTELCVWQIFDGQILNQDTSVVWTFYQVLNTVRLKCGGIIKNGWMIDPLNLATKHDEYLAPSWRKPWVLLDLDMIARTILTGGWALGTSWRDSLSFVKFFASKKSQCPIALLC